MRGTINMKSINTTTVIIFVSLLLDLLAFTMILPLLPSLLRYYELHDETGLYKWLSNHISYFQDVVGAPQEYKTVLFGGFLGSMFSFLQFVASPFVGAISDVFGRKPVMIICLIGITISHVVWVMSSNLIIFILARFIGGISKGNVSLAMIIMTDASTERNRSSVMALVGIAFSIGFILGPLIGALFAVWARERIGEWYQYPATFALILSLLDLIFFSCTFKETLPQGKRHKSVQSSLQTALDLVNFSHLLQFKAVTTIDQATHRKLRSLGQIYFVYLFIYSGLEFTVTFLTHYVFNYTSMEQGWMFFCVGIVMASLQSGFVRKVPMHKIKDVASFGLWLIIPSFVCVGISYSVLFLYIGLLLYAISTALVVPLLTTMVSSLSSVQQRGTVIGIFRSLGALARALGPIVASIAFWSIGSKATYMIGACCLLWPALKLQKL